MSLERTARAEECDRVRELIPDVATERAAERDSSLVENHVGRCRDCRLEAELVTLVWTTRPRAPDDLAASVRDAVEAAPLLLPSLVARSTGAAEPVEVSRRGRPTYRSRWTTGASPGRAAAVLVAVLGIGYLTTVARDGAELPPYARELSEYGSIWIAEDGTIAGEPALDELSDDLLDELIESFDPNWEGEQ